MKNYSTRLIFISGLIGTLIHTLIVTFLVSYLAYPEMLHVMIDVSSGAEKEMLQSFVTDMQSFEPIVYFGFAIIAFEWLALFRIRKFENKMTPFWSSYLILGSLFAYFYFGGLEVFILLFLSGTLSLYKYFKFYRLLHFKNSEE